MSLLTNLLAVWKFNESSGNAADSTATGFTLTNNNTITYTSGLLGNCADLGTSNSNKYFNNATDYSSSLYRKDFTINLWVNIGTQVGTNGRYTFFGNVSKSGSAEKDIRVEYYDTSGTKGLVFQMGNYGGTDMNVTYNTTLSTSTWYMITCVYNYATKGATLYLNGSSVATGTDPDNAFSNGNTLGTYFGSWVGAAFFASTKFDISSIWTRVLSGSEITSLYNSGAALDYPYPGGANYLFSRLVTEIA